MSKIKGSVVDTFYTNWYKIEYRLNKNVNVNRIECYWYDTNDKEWLHEAYECNQFCEDNLQNHKDIDTIIVISKDVLSLIINDKEGHKQKIFSLIETLNQLENVVKRLTIEFGIVFNKKKENKKWKK